MKALYAVLMITGIMSVFTLVNLEQGESTGALVNGIGQIRLDRIIQAGQGFPYSYACKEQLDSIDQLMRLNADSRHYTPYGIQDAETFFANERVLYGLLESVAGNKACELSVRQRAGELLRNLTATDTRLVEWTIKHSECKALAERELRKEINMTAMNKLRMLENAAMTARYCRISKNF